MAGAEVLCSGASELLESTNSLVTGSSTLEALAFDVTISLWKYLRVDGTNHAALAMHRLRAVEPDRLGVHNTDCVCQLLTGGDGGSIGWHESREERVRLVSHHVLYRNAGLVEGRLDNGVVLLRELEREGTRIKDEGTFGLNWN